MSKLTVIRPVPVEGNFRTALGFIRATLLVLVRTAHPVAEAVSMGDQVISDQTNPDVARRRASIGVNIDLSPSYARIDSLSFGYSLSYLVLHPGRRRILNDTP